MLGGILPVRRIRPFDFVDRYVEDYLNVKDPKSGRHELGRLRRPRSPERAIRHSETKDQERASTSGRP
jgi:hypothetical protein